jgi:predicted DNA-binding protein
MVYMYKKDRTEQVNIRMTPEEKERLKRFALYRGMSVTEILCRAVDTYITQRDKDCAFKLPIDL